MTQSEQNISFELNKIRLEKQAEDRLESIRKSIEAENVSYGELVELQSLKDYIKPDDILLLQWAGAEEEICTKSE